MCRRQRVKMLLVLVLLLWGFSMKCDAREQEEIRQMVDETIHKTKTSAISVVVYDHGEVSFYGNGAKDGVYQIGSMTKAFTGLAMKKLIQEGIVDPQSPIDTYLPGFQVSYQGKPCAITVEQLLTQTSGFTNAEKLYPSAQDGMSLHQWADSISGSELQTLPGAVYAYANANYNLLGAIIEEVSDMSYQSYLEKEILEPLGLQQVYVGCPTEDFRVVSGSRLGYGRTFLFDQEVREGSIPAGYLYANPEAMTRWMAIWLGQISLSPKEQQLIDAVYEELMQERGYDAGWEWMDGDKIGHSGGTCGYSSRILFSREEQVGVCVLNSVNVAASTDQLCNDIMRLVTGEEPGGFVYDVWTIFDKVFSVMSVFLVLWIPVKFLLVRHRKVQYACGIISILLMIGIALILTTIFRASIQEILFVWAPWSMLGTMILLGIDGVTVFLQWGIKIRMSSR